MDDLPRSESSDATGDGPRARASRGGGAFARARRDLAAGRPDLARDRLTGFLYTLHRRGEYSEEAYLLLGEALFAMKDFARAGAAWLLTRKQGPEADAAFAAFEKRYGKDGANALRAVKPRAPSEDYPPEVQARLRAWDYRYRPYRPRGNPHVETELGERKAGLRIADVGCLVLGLLGFLAAAAIVLRVLGKWR